MSNFDGRYDRANSARKLKSERKKLRELWINEFERDVKNSETLAELKDVLLRNSNKIVRMI